jgi:uncharacterized membrane protein YdbT with pleckstrin-like domain
MIKIVFIIIFFLFLVVIILEFLSIFITNFSLEVLGLGLAEGLLVKKQENHVV